MNTAVNTKSVKTITVPRGLEAVERALAETRSGDYAPIAEPERIVKIGEQQGAVMKKVCDEVARQFETKIELAEAAIGDLSSHRDHLIEEIKKYMDTEIDQRKAEVERMRQSVRDITSWVRDEARNFAEHATEVADKLSRLQERVSAASSGIPKSSAMLESQLADISPPKRNASKEAESEV